MTKTRFIATFLGALMALVCVIGCEKDIHEARLPSNQPQAAALAHR